MKLVEFRKYGAQIATHGSGYSITRATGKILGVLPFAPEPASMEIDSWVKLPPPSWAVQQSLNSLLKLDFDKIQVGRNSDLSVTGIAKHMAPIKDEAVKTMSHILRDFAKHKGAIANVEIHRYAIPQLDRTDVVGYLRDREIRDAMRGMGDDPKVFSEVADNPEVILSMLRSPTPFKRHEKFAEESWHSLIDKRDPAGVETLNQEKASIDWAERVLAAVKQNVISELDFTKGQLYEKTAANDAAGLWGFTTGEVVHQEREKQYRAAG